MKNKFKVVVAIISLGITGIASAANTCPVKVTQSNDEVSQHIEAILNGENGNSNNSVEVKHIDLPSFKGGDGTFDTFVGGFKFVDADTLTQFGNEVLRNEIKNNTPDIYAYMQDFEKAIVEPNLKNVSNLLLYRKTLAYVSKLNLGQLRAYAQGILDYQAQNPSDTADSEALAFFAHGVIDYYNIFFKVALDKPLTDREKAIVSASNYPIMVMANKAAVDLNNGLYKGVADNSCNYSSGCNETIRTANAIMAEQAMGGNSDITVNQQIISGSLSYVFNLALLNKSPKVYQALNDTKNQAYQKAQLAMLTDIDQQLRKLNQKQN